MPSVLSSSRAATTPAGTRSPRFPAAVARGTQRFDHIAGILAGRRGAKGDFALQFQGRFLDRTGQRLDHLVARDGWKLVLARPPV